MSGIVLKGYKKSEDSEANLFQDEGQNVNSTTNNGYVNGDLGGDKISDRPPSYHEVVFAPETGNGSAAKEIDSDDKKSKKDKKKKEKEEKPPMIPFSTLFRYATGLDKLLMFLGVIGALLHGAVIPISFILFGELTDDFINYAKQYTIVNMVPPVNASVSNTTVTPPVIIPFDLKGKMAEFAIYYVILAVGNFIVAYLQTATWAATAERLTYRIRLMLFRSVMRQDIGWFDTHDAGEINSRLTEDITKIHNGIGDKISLLMQCLTVFLGGFIIGFIYGAKLTAVIIALTPVLMITGAIMSKLITGLTTEELDSYAKAGSIAEEVISSIRTVAAFGGEDKEYQRYTSNLDKAKSFGVRKGLNTGLGFGFLYIVMFGCYALAFWYGAKLIIEGEMTGGRLLIVFFSVLTAAFQLGQAGPYVEAISTARGAGYRVFGIIDRVPPIDSSSTAGEQPDHLQGDISFEEVDFFYPSRPEVQILNKMSLKVPGGKTVALVGESGCGKSTTTKLILRFYDPHSGVVKLDGKDIRDLNLKWLRNHIGVVSQEPVLFATSISENIRYGHDGVTQQQIEAAAKAANAHSFITKFPQGYDTLVGERGAQMSGGQKQRIAIARALVRDPKILLLDEATSALDTESEGIVQAALDKAREGRTTIIIAHRLSTVRTADTIAAFQDGIIVEQGTHDELMDINGIYNQLVTLQTFNDGDEGEDEDLDEEDKEISKGVKFFRSLSNMSSASEGETELERTLSRRLSRRLSAGKRQRTVSEKSIEPKKEEPIEEDDVEPSPFLRIMKLNLQEWPYLLLGLFGALLNGAFPMVFALIFGEILAVFALTDDEKMQKEANFWSAMFLVIGGTSFIGNIFQSYFFALSGETLTKRLRSTAFKAILRQDISFFDDPKHSTGALTTNLSSHASKIQGAAGLRLGTMFMTIVMALGCLILAFISGWKLTLVMLAFVPLLVITGIIQMKQITGTNKTAKDAEECGKVAVETVGNIHTVVSLGKEEVFLKNYESALSPTFRKGMKDAQIIGISFGLSESIMFLCNAAAFYYGGVLIQDGEMTLDEVMKVVLAIMIGAMTAGNMSAGTPDYAKARVAATHLFQLFDRVPAIDHESLEGIKLDSVSGSIEVHQVQFNYPTRPDQKVLRDLNLAVHPGQTLALVGSSGCGKSTLVSLLERFYDADHGSLFIDGHEVRACNVKWLRSQMGIVSQEPVLFDCSIRDNIAYGDNTGTFTQGEIEAAAKSANIHNFIASLPQGYDTMVGDKGTLISGGQKQRIAIARALIRNPKILLLDEATSALDTESEKVVQEALDAASEGRTCIVIAHRLSTIQNADKIAVIHAGKVVELGTHQELLAMKGTYYLLNAGQTTSK